ncbi:hypothetical protein [Pseudomonas carassii]|uniref:Uncharacterized protein n=1 Tax=Pseudomonas carassii TaxID=3115855 RepID=A0ABU7HFZ1_9PSED|nr:hypothetical protein [Pseudomonas sp. 137P]MEE1890106.1 hypothetical protein [Pseudomonas sp. 137P]
MNLHVGSSFDDFLLEVGLDEEVSEAASKRVLIWQLLQTLRVCAYQASIERAGGGMEDLQRQ